MNLLGGYFKIFIEIKIKGIRYDFLFDKIKGWKSIRNEGVSKVNYDW